MDHNLEKIIEQALALIERGKSVREILEMFPEDKKELQELFHIFDVLKDQKEKIVPSKELLTKIIAHLPESPIKTEKEKIPFHRNVRIRDLMAMNWNVWAPVGITALILIIIGFNQFGAETPQIPPLATPKGIPQTPVATEQPSVALKEVPEAPVRAETPHIPPPLATPKGTPQAPVATEQPSVASVPATDNSIDDAVNGILADIGEETLLFADAEKDFELIGADSQVISDFEQSYNDNEL